MLLGCSAFVATRLLDGSLLLLPEFFVAQDLLVPEAPELSLGAASGWIPNDLALSALGERVVGR